MNQFAVKNLVPEEKPAIYSHGFSDEEVEKIKKLKEEISKRDLNTEPVTLDEFQKVIVPWNRIRRTESFILNHKEKKPAKRKASTSTPRVTGPKKLTKKAIEKKLNYLVFKQATGVKLTEEEQQFFKEHIKNIGGL